MKKPMLPTSKVNLAAVRGVLLFSVGMLYLLNVIFEMGIDQLIVSISVVTFLFCFFYMNTVPRALTLVMLIMGHICYFAYGGDAVYWREAVLKNLSFVTLFITVPLLSIPLRLGSYVDSIVKVTRKLSHKPVLVPLMVVCSTSLLTSFMNIGSMRIVMDLFNEQLESNPKVYIKAIFQGFCLSLIFSPYIAGVAIILYILDLTLIPFLLYGLIFVFLGFIISTLLVAKEVVGLSDQHKTYSLPVHEGNKKKDLGLIVGFLGLFLSIIALDHILHINLIIIVSLIAMIYPIVWTFLIKKQKGLKSELQNYRNHILPNVHNESIMIVTASFFSQMFQLSPFPKYLLTIFEIFTSHSQYIVVFIVLSLIVLFSLIGIHQIVSVSILASSVDPAVIHLSPILFAVTLTIGWSMGTLLNPVSALNILGTNLLDLKYKNLLRWNWRFVVMMILATSIIIPIFNNILGSY